MACEVVMADDEGRAGVAELLELALLEAFGGLEFEVDDVEAGFGGLGEDLELGGEVAGELAAVGFAAAGGDGRGGGVVGEELLQLRQRSERLFEVVEAELEEGRLFDDGGGFFNHLGRRGAVMATQTLPMRERRSWGLTLGTFDLMAAIAVSYRPAGKDANFR